MVNDEQITLPLTEFTMVTNHSNVTVIVTTITVLATTSFKTSKLYKIADRFWKSLTLIVNVINKVVPL